MDRGHRIFRNARMARIFMFIASPLLFYTAMESMPARRGSTMTPEERLRRIENAIQALTENQTRHDTEIDKHNAAIRDLITASRIFLDSQKEVSTQIQGLRDAQKDANERLSALDDRLNALIRNVDRFL